MNEGFFIEREWTQTLQGAELLIYAYIATTCKNCGGVCECSKANIAKWTGVSVRTMERPIKRLQERGLLTIQEIAGKYNRYIANPYANCVPLRKMCTPTQNEGETPTQNVYPRIIINNNNKIKEKIKNIETTTPKKFVKPTEAEVAQYCAERGNDINAAEFVDFYESKGWVVGKSPMKDWRAAVRTWENSHKKRYNNEQRNSKNRQYNQEVDAAILAGLLAE